MHTQWGPWHIRGGRERGGRGWVGLDGPFRLIIIVCPRRCLACTGANAIKWLSLAIHRCQKIIIFGHTWMPWNNYLWPYVEPLLHYFCCYCPVCWWCYSIAYSSLIQPFHKNLYPVNKSILLLNTDNNNDNIGQDVHYFLYCAKQPYWNRWNVRKHERKIACRIKFPTYIVVSFVSTM